MSSMSCAARPRWPGGRSTGSAISRGRSRRRGLHGLWVTDSFGRGRPTLDPVVLMSVIAAVTQRIEIGTCVLQVPVRHPVELAHRIAVAARDDRRPADARASAAARPRPISTSSARITTQRFKTLMPALETMREAWRGEELAGGTLTPWPGTEGGPGAAARRLAQQALDRLCRRAMRRLDRLGALPEAGGARSRHQVLPRRRRQARGPVQRHHRPARQRRGHAAGRQGVRSC